MKNQGFNGLFAFILNLAFGITIGLGVYSLSGSAAAACFFCSAALFFCFILFLQK